MNTHHAPLSFIASSKMWPTLCMAGLLLLFWNGCFAQDRLENLRNELALASNDSLTIELKIKISRELHKQAGHIDEDIEIATEAVNRAISSPYTVLYARALNNLGLLYRYHQQYALAIPLHVKAFEIIKNMEG